MYEIALSEWHVTPDYINRNWTEELLQLMFLKREERLAAIANGGKSTKYRDKNLFENMGQKVKRVTVKR